MLAAELTAIGLDDSTAQSVCAQSAALSVLDRRELLAALKVAGVTKMGLRQKTAALIESHKARSLCQSRSNSAVSESTVTPAAKFAGVQSAAARAAVPAPSTKFAVQTAAAKTLALPPPDLRAADPSFERFLDEGAAAHVTYEVVAQVVKVRTSPSLDAPVLTYRQKGQRVVADAEDGEWVRLANGCAPRPRICAHSARRWSACKAVSTHT